MPRYILKSAAFIDDMYRNVGDEIEYAGVPGPHMDPHPDDAAAKAAKKKAGEIVAPGHPAYLGNLMHHNVTDGRTEGRSEASSAFALQVDENGQVRGVQSEDPADAPGALTDADTKTGKK